MAINPSRYDMPGSFVGEIDWSPLARIGQQLKDQRDQEEAAQLLGALYGRGASQPTSAPVQQTRQASQQPTIERAMIPPVPGYSVAGKPTATPSAAPTPDAPPTAVAGPVDAPLWLQSGQEGSYAPGAPEPRVDPRSPIGRLMARLGMGPSPESVTAPFPVAGAAPVPGLSADGTPVTGPAPVEEPWYNPALAQAGVGWPLKPGATPPATDGAVPPWPGGAPPAEPVAVAERIPLPRERPATPDVALPPTAAAPPTYSETGQPSPQGIDRALAVIRQKESSGNYRNVTTTRNRRGEEQRALGAYGVMDFNVGPWTKEALGRELTPTEFLTNDAAQDAVARYKFGQYAQKYGTTGAARAWFAGERGMHNPNARDPLGTSVMAYAADFDRKLGLPPEITTGSSRAEEPTTAMAFDARAPQGVAPAQRAYQNLASQEPASSADISTEELQALYRNPITRPIATAFLQKRLDPGTYKFMAAGENVIRYNERTGQYDMIRASQKPVVVGKKLVDPDTGKVIYGSDDQLPDEPPANTYWVDPKDKSKGVQPLPGTTNTQMPAEVAAKVGLGEAFLKRLPAIRKQIEGDALGIDANPTAHLAAVAGSVGPGAEIKRQIESGADSLLRMLTGAGMNDSEAEKYVKRYEVNARDTKAQLLSKLQQLEEDMHFTADKIGVGRGGSPLARVPRVFGDAPGAISPGAAPAPTQAAPTQAQPTISQTKTINGVTYGRVGDKWYPLNAARQ